MNLLETRLIEQAKRHLAELSHAHNRLNGERDLDADEDFIRAHAALCSLLELAHIANSGLSPDAEIALLAIEAEHSLLLGGESVTKAARSANSIAVRFRDGSTSNVDVSKAEHTMILGGMKVE